MKQLILSFIFIGLYLNTFGQLLTNTTKQTEEYAYLTIESETSVVSGNETEQTKTTEIITHVTITNGVLIETIMIFKKNNTELYYINQIAKVGWVFIEVINNIQVDEHISFTETDKYTNCKTILFKRLLKTTI
jgi:hypothetical protein